jgi:plastocyanin
MRPLCAAAVITMLLATVVAVPGIASEDDAPDHLVHAGAVADDPLKPYSYWEYFPRDLTVHQGDRVRWEFPVGELFDTAFHTVTFAADPEEVPWLRRDEVPGTFAFDERSFFSSGCGRPGQPVCVLTDPDKFVSSGTPIGRAGDAGIEPFDAVVDLPPGTYSYFCTIHHPAMQGTIEVVEADVDIDNPAPEDFADLIAELTAEADALAAELSQPTPVDVDGQRVWTVHAGARTRDEGGGVGIIGFLPASLSVRAGDEVRWLSRGEGDGVVFPDPGPLPTPLSFFSFNCEPDEPDGGAPGIPLIGWAALVSGGGCPAGSSLEMVATPHAVEPSRAPGNAVVTPTTFHNSGVMIPPDRPERLRGKPQGSGEHLPSEFDASFPVPGTFPYRCQLHWDMMGGSITVQG